MEILYLCMDVCHWNSFMFSWDEMKWKILFNKGYLFLWCFAENGFVRIWWWEGVKHFSCSFVKSKLNEMVISYLLENLIKNINHILLMLQMLKMFYNPFREQTD